MTNPTKTALNKSYHQGLSKGILIAIAMQKASSKAHYLAGYSAGKNNETLDKSRRDAMVQDLEKALTQLRSLAETSAHFRNKIQEFSLHQSDLFYHFYNRI